MRSKFKLINNTNNKQTNHTSKWGCFHLDSPLQCIKCSISIHNSIHHRYQSNNSSILVSEHFIRVVSDSFFIHCKKYRHSSPCNKFLEKSTTNRKRRDFCVTFVCETHASRFQVNLPHKAQIEEEEILLVQMTKIAFWLD